MLISAVFLQKIEDKKPIEGSEKVSQIREKTDSINRKVTKLISTITQFHQQVGTVSP